MLDALAKLTKSRKALVFVAIVAALAAMVYTGQLTSEQFIAFLVIAFPAWLVAHAGEEGAKAIGSKPKADVIARAIAAFMDAEDATTTEDK